MQTNTISRAIVGLNRVVITIQLNAESSEEQEAINQMATGKASDKQKVLVETPILNYYNNAGLGYILINAEVRKNGMVDMILEKAGMMGAI